MAKVQRSLGNYSTAMETGIGALARSPGSKHIHSFLLELAYSSDTYKSLRLVLATRLRTFHPDITQTKFWQTYGITENANDSFLAGFSCILDLIFQRKPRRYGQLYHHLIVQKPKNILEIGVFNGVNSMQMIESANVLRNPIEPELNFYGLDLFEDMTEGMIGAELSKLPLSEAEVYQKLSVVNANVKLVRGNTFETLPKFKKRFDEKSEKVDFVFIDGGHHVKTIANDWENCKSIISDVGCVFFDDYYVARPEELSEFGCNDLITELLEDSTYHVEILPVIDVFRKEFGELNIALVRVSKRIARGTSR